MVFKTSSSASRLARPHFPSEDDNASPSVVRAKSNLERSVYCIQGIPIDAIDVATVAENIEAAAIRGEAFVLSTPNLNFLATSLLDPAFRESVLASDLCPPDGIPLIWIAQLLGLPIKQRAAGADLLDCLHLKNNGRRLSIFLFGGAKGVAAEAAAKINARAGYLSCVGSLDPGYRDVSEMSTDQIIETINSSGADFLVLSLGAKKGQLWLQRNHDRLTIPVRSHLGAAMNFQAGVLTRAPPIVRTLGFEWLWRIKEERYLWKRYRNDGFVLLRLLFTRVLPLAALGRWQQMKWKQQVKTLLIERTQELDGIKIKLCGTASESHISEATSCFRELLADKHNILIDLEATRWIDARFFGLLLMLRKELKCRGRILALTGASRRIKRLFRLNELEFLLKAENGS